MVGIGLLALGWKATKLAGRSSGKCGASLRLRVPAPGKPIRQLHVFRKLYTRSPWGSGVLGYGAFGPVTVLSGPDKHV